MTSTALSSPPVSDSLLKQLRKVSTTTVVLKTSHYKLITVQSLDQIRAWAYVHRLTITEYMHPLKCHRQQIKQQLYDYTMSSPSSPSSRYSLRVVSNGRRRRFLFFPFCFIDLRHIPKETAQFSTPTYPTHDAL